MRNGNIVHAIYSQRELDNPAICLLDGTSYSSRSLFDRFSKMARALRDLGVETGDRVSFRLEKSIDTLVLAHACLGIGAILHPINTSYTDDEVSFLIRDCEPALFVCEESERQRFSNIASAVGVAIISLTGANGSLVNAAASSERTSEIVAVTADATAALLYTSGTTGKPKGSRITHGNLVHSAAALASIWKISDADCVLHALPIYHAHGLFAAINPAFFGGARILLLPSFDTGEVLSGLSKATIMMGVPTYYSRLLAEPDLPRCVSPQFRLAISGSAPLSADIASKFFERTGRSIYQRYGSTEATIITAMPADRDNRPGYVGSALPGVEIRVAMADGTRVPVGTGALETRGPNVFAGYWNNPAADGGAFTEDRWFITGDLAEIGADGCVKLLGRTKELIISGGLNVYPREVEIALERMTDVEEAAVFGVPHQDFGEAVVAVVTSRNGETVDEAAARTELKKHLAAYKVPKRIVTVPEMPRNSMGKAQKTELRQRLTHLFNGSEG